VGVWDGACRDRFTGCVGVDILYMHSIESGKATSSSHQKYSCVFIVPLCSRVCIVLPLKVIDGRWCTPGLLTIGIRAEVLT